MNITAKWGLDNNTLEAPVLNPGDWFGKTCLLSVGVGNFTKSYVVEADTMADAMDILAEDEEYGHIIAIDAKVEGDDYGEPLSDGIELNPKLDNMANILAARWKVDRNTLWVSIKGTILRGPLSVPCYSGQGVAYDMDNLYAQGGNPVFPCRYYGDGLPEDGVAPVEYDEYLE